MNEWYCSRCARYFASKEMFAVACPMCDCSDLLMYNEGDGYHNYEVDSLGLYDNFGDWHPDESNEEFWEHE
jgi:hypothetical protein